MGSWLADKIIAGVIAWFVGIVVGALDTLWGLLSATLLRSPDVTRLPQVTGFAGTSLAVVNTAYVLAFLWVAVLVMGRDTIQSRHGPGELIPRLIIGLIGANFAIPLCSTLIGAANAITEALTSDPITSQGTLEYLKNTTYSAINSYTAANSPKAFLIMLIALIVAVLVGMLLIQWIIRLGVLIVVVSISPIALALHGTPQTEAAAKLWWRTLLGTLGTVVIQAVALHTTLKVFLAPGDNLTVLGLPGVAGAAEPGAVLNLLVVVCMLIGVLKVPALMRRYITKSSPGFSGQVLRIVLIQQLTRGIFRGGRTNRGGRVPAPASRTGPAARWPTTS
jgi:hypothetical protein